MHLVRRAVVGACVTVMALGVVGVSSAAAYDRPSHRQVVASLLTSDQLPDRWAIDEELAAIAERWAIDPDRDLRRIATPV